MGAIARFCMQGPRQAALLAVLFAALPLMYWVSAAIVALVVLRQGFNKGLNILLAALLPGVAWYAMQQDITIFVVVLGSGIMAAVLRASESLPKAIALSVLVGASSVALLPTLSPDWSGVLEQAAEEYTAAFEGQMDANMIQEVQPWIFPILLGAVTSMLQLFAISALLLGRSWQARLYNPGGFKQEFHTLRMPYWYGLVVVAVFLISGSDPQWGSWMPIILVPMFVMGISVVHGVIAMGRLSSQWLFGFYISFLFFLPYMYALLILVAMLDLLVDFRKRISQSAK